MEDVPLLGNHVEPIVFLFAPLFAIFRHPMLFVFVQNAALASMALTAYAIARRLGFSSFAACSLGCALLLFPATGFVALHEFHPEALTAPFLLLLIHARIVRSVWRHWLWFVAVLACKENMALLLGAYCAVFLILERKTSPADLARFYVWPMAVAVFWFLFCALVITPKFNAGNIDYFTLYNRLGDSPTGVLRNFFTQPQLFVVNLWHALTTGNLVWALLLPLLALPLFRPRWLAIATPVLLQHLLSWRSSEWTIYFHYAAPLIPLFWIAAVEAIAPALNGERRLRFLNSPWLPPFVAVACALAFVLIGPLTNAMEDFGHYAAGKQDRERKNSFLSQIPPSASVVAGLPYLSHLAMREKLYSLHYILKGLKTLSHESYTPPPPTDFVFIDYNDDATFDAGAGYYHPPMQTKDGHVIPSSDKLLRQFFARKMWLAEMTGSLTLIHQGWWGPSHRMFVQQQTDLVFGDGTKLLGFAVQQHPATEDTIPQLRLVWEFPAERSIFPWLFLRLRQNGKTVMTVTKGLCAPEASNRLTDEIWKIDGNHVIPSGTYQAEAVFVDRPKQLWIQQTGGGDDQSPLLVPPVAIGEITIP